MIVHNTEISYLFIQELQGFAHQSNKNM